MKDNSMTLLSGSTESLRLRSVDTSADPSAAGTIGLNEYDLMLRKQDAWSSISLIGDYDSVHASFVSSLNPLVYFPLGEASGNAISEHYDDTTGALELAPTNISRSHPSLLGDAEGYVTETVAGASLIGTTQRYVNKFLLGSKQAWSTSIIVKPQSFNSPSILIFCGNSRYATTVPTFTLMGVQPTGQISVGGYFGGWVSHISTNANLRLVSGETALFSLSKSANGELHMYKNGVLYETQTGVMVSGTTGTSLGLARIALLKAYGDPGTTNYVGKLAHVSIWDRVLTDEEHAQLAASAGFH